jgi:NTE family protein
MKGEMEVMNNERPKIAFALGSGGAKGFAHIGVLRAFEELGIKPDLIVGSSMGAIVGACYCLGVDVDTMEQRARALSTTKILDIKLPNNYGFIKGDKAEKVIREFLQVGDEDSVSFDDCKIPFACVAANLSVPNIVDLTKGDLLKSIRASFSINGVFQAVEINGKKLTDGGILCRVPVDLARKMGADIVIAIDCTGKTMPENIESNSYMDTIARIFTVMDYEISKHEIRRADFLVTMHQPNISSIRIKNVKESIEIGYKAVMDNSNELKRLIQT